MRLRVCCAIDVSDDIPCSVGDLKRRCANVFGTLTPEQLVASIESGRVLSNEEILKVPENSMIELAPRDSVLVVPVNLPTKSLSICVPKTASLGDLKKAVNNSQDGWLCDAVVVPPTGDDRSISDDDRLSAFMSTESEYEIRLSVAPFFDAIPEDLLRMILYNEAIVSTSSIRTHCNLSAVCHAWRALLLCRTELVIPALPYLRRHPLSDPDTMLTPMCLSSVVSHLPQLINLDLTGRPSACSGALLPTLEFSCPNLRVLRVRDCGIDDEGIRHTASLFGRLHTLELSISPRLTRQGLHAIMTQGSESLHNLTISVDSSMQKSPDQAMFTDIAKVFSGHVLPSFTHLKLLFPIEGHVLSDLLDDLSTSLVSLSVQMIESVGCGEWDYPICPHVEELEVRGAMHPVLSMMLNVCPALRTLRLPVPPTVDQLRRMVTTSLTDVSIDDRLGAGLATALMDHCGDALERLMVRHLAPDALAIVLTKGVHLRKLWVVGDPDEAKRAALPELALPGSLIPSSDQLEDLQLRGQMMALSDGLLKLLSHCTKLRSLALCLGPSAVRKHNVKALLALLPQEMTQLQLWMPQERRQGVFPCGHLPPNLVQLRLNHAVLCSKSVKKLVALRRLEVLDLHRAPDFYPEYLRELVRKAPCSLRRIRVPCWVESLEDRALHAAAAARNLTLC